MTVAGGWGVARGGVAADFAGAASGCSDRPSVTTAGFARRGGRAALRGDRDGAAATSRDGAVGITRAFSCGVGVLAAVLSAVALAAGTVVPCGIESGCGTGVTIAAATCALGVVRVAADTASLRPRCASTATIAAITAPPISDIAPRNMRSAGASAMRTSCPIRGNISVETGVA